MAHPDARTSLGGQLGTVKVAVVIIATILTGFTLYALRRMLEPFVMALFLLIMVDGVARLLNARVPGFPKKAALPVAIGAIVLVFALTIWITADNAHALALQAPTYTAHINTLLSNGAQRLGLNVTPTLADLIEKLNPSRFAGVLAEAVSHFAEAAVFVLIYLGFLVASRQGFAAKTSQLFGSAEDRAEAQRVFFRVRRGVEQYIWVQTLVGVLITALSAVLMTLTGLSHIPFWCLIIFMANYIPAVGAAIGVLFPALFGLVEVDGVTRAIVLLVGLEAIHFLVSHVVQPRMQGKSLNVDPIVVLLALAFWSAVWGVTGAFLSTPLTVLAMAILAEFKGTRPLAVLLSGDGRPDADMAD
ncbi:AI-2E family transporter [Phenylobacterium aquaticum]|uniref:AI-2E family transporter n=1 Tax=Phenylobacterium aquaticum TaxID=1763816 RepID=UPI001F5D6560|nr:AI-2E family transporter [Phenylobacterium aquaticum]MCI3134871.1 AI-2E family transporter [Phenylobacterium aquaticum]